MNNKRSVVQVWSKKYPGIKLIRDIKSGKEASLVLIEINHGLKCLKIYNRLSMASKSNNEYLSGKWFRQKNTRKAIDKGNKFSHDLLKKLWIKREFYLLKKLYQQKAIVPQVFDYNNDSIIMEYLGDLTLSAPLIKDIDFTQKQAQKAFDLIIESIKIFFKNGIVHADLSEFNILWWQQKPYIIDFPQSIDIRNNLNYKKFLEKDINNIVIFFNKWIPINQKKLMANILASF